MWPKAISVPYSLLTVVFEGICTVPKNMLPEKGMFVHCCYNLHLGIMIQISEWGCIRKIWFNTKFTPQIVVLYIRVRKWFKWTHILGSNDWYNTFGVIFRFKPRYLVQTWTWTIWYNQSLVTYLVFLLQINQGYSWKYKTKKEAPQTTIHECLFYLCRWYDLNTICINMFLKHIPIVYADVHKDQHIPTVHAYCMQMMLHWCCTIM